MLSKHPCQIYNKGHNVSVSENSLLYKLSNFGIKDESVLESKGEQEWWCIREVFYRANGELSVCIFKLVVLST